MPGETVIVELAQAQENWAVLPDTSWLRRIRGQLSCECCDRRLADVSAAINVTLAQAPEDESYRVVFGGLCGIISGRLLDYLAPHFPAHSLGTCSRNDGVELPDYFSIFFLSTIPFIRGDASAEYELCRKCALIGCSTDGPYVLRSELPSGNVYQDRVGGLYISDELARRFPWKRFPDLQPDRIPVREAVLPDDPLPAVLAAVAALREAFCGDWAAAFRAVELEVRRFRLGESVRTLNVEVMGIPLQVSGHTRGGVLRIASFRMTAE